MLRFFRVNDPYRLLGVLLIMLGCAAPMLFSASVFTLPELKDLVLGETLNQGKSMYVNVISDVPWLAAQTDRFMAGLFGHSLVARHILAFILLFIQTALFSLALIRVRAFNELNYLPALLFGVLCFFSFDMLTLSAELLGTTFLLFALNNILREIEFKVQYEETIFSIGFYLGIASLFVFSFSIFLPGTLIILAIYARADFRKSVLLTFGFLFPHLVLALFYFFKDGSSALFSVFYGSQWSGGAAPLLSWSSLFWLMATPLGFLLFSWTTLGREARFTRYQSQVMQVMLLWLLLGIIEIMRSRAITPHSMIVCIPSVVYFINHLMLLIRRRWLAEMMLWIFMVSIIAIGFIARKGTMHRIDYSGLYVTKPSSAATGKRIMVLSDNWSYYLENIPATDFLAWPVSRRFFEETDYFENRIRVRDCLERDKPSLIIDPDDVLKNTLALNPSLRKQYRRTPEGYERVE